MRHAAILAATLLLAGPAQGLTLAGVGDSLTAGGDWFAFLPPEWTALDHGEPGEESWQGEDRFRDVILPALGPEVDVVSILYGTNDVRKGLDRTAESIASMQALAMDARDAGYGVVLMGAPPLIDPAGSAADLALWNGRLETIRATMEPWAASQGIPYVDLYDAFLGHPDTQSLFLFGNGTLDGVHPWMAGRELIAEQAVPAIQQAPEPGIALMVLSMIALIARARDLPRDLVGYACGGLLGSGHYLRKLWAIARDR